MREGNRRATLAERLGCSLACGLAALLWAAAAAAQLPGFPSLFPDPLKSAQRPAGDASPTASAAGESREKAVERLRAQIAEVNAARASPTEPPDGIPTPEAAALEDARAQLVAANELQIRSFAELDAAKAARAAAEAALRNWGGFDEKPPYSILLVDELRDAADAVQARVAASERSGAHLASETERYVRDTKRAEESVRRTQETAEQARDHGDRARAAWRRDLAEVRLRAIASRAAVTQILRQIQAEELATRRAELALLTRKIDVASVGATFSEADLARAKERIASLHENLRAEQQTLAVRLGPREREREQAARALEQLRAQAQAPADEVAVAEARLRAAEAWVLALRTERDLLDGMGTLAEDMSRTWDARRTAVTAADADERAAAGEQLRTAASRLVRWRGYLDSFAQLRRVALREAEAAVMRGDSAPSAARFEQDNVAALRRGLSSLERAQDTVETLARTFDRWVADFEAARASRSLASRIADQWSVVKSWTQTVWNFELFAVEDSAIVDGKEVRTSRGVTVGKSVGALLVFVLGYWLAAAVARRVERGLVRRGFDVRRVRNTRRWVLLAVGAMLALFTLNIARIPLTVFAFLGGALAIGVGFGSQTIIRNFVSGLIMLVERRIQIGDIVEVDGVTGTVTAVDLRSSTVLGFDGVETAVPNSVFLESKVTNWTQTDKRIRRVVKVGVAYGSPIREAADALEECAKRHGLVLDDPAPMVIFEDFGSDALVFALYFWVELRSGVSALQVGSDLRHMIARRLAETGIIVAFPQRDVHLDTARPLRVELARARSTPGAATGG